MSYFPTDIPFMSGAEREHHGITAAQPELATNLQPTCNNGANVPKQPTVPPMPELSNNSLKLNSGNGELIYRQAAIDELIKMLGYCFQADDALVDAVLTTMQELPSAQQEQRWIPVEEALPEEPYGCLVTVWDEEPMTGEMFENLLPYFVGWDGEQWNDSDGEQCPFEVIAYMPLPEPYQPETGKLATPKIDGESSQNGLMSAT